MTFVASLFYPLVEFLNAYKWYFLIGILLYLVLTIIFRHSRTLITVVFGVLVLVFVITHLGGVYAQTISAAISDARIYNEMLQSSRSYIIDIGGGTTNVISIIDRKPQNPGITLEEMGVLELFKLAHRTIMEDCGRNIDDFMIDVLMQGRKSCPDAMKASIERAKNEFVKKLILELEARKVDLYMGYICMVGGGGVLLFDAFHRYITEKGNNDIVLIPDVKANARGYYAQEMARLASAGIEVYRGKAKA